MLPLIIIQARTGSTRLPNKMTKPFFNEESVLDILLKRLLQNKENLNVADIVVATTTNPGDNAIVDICNKLGVKYYRGSENDVLQRFIDTANYFKADKIIRICADNVFLDIPALSTIAHFLHNNDYEYVSFKTADDTPSILTHFGLFAEGVKLTALNHVAHHTNNPKAHEHVTYQIHQSQDLYKVKLFPIDDAIHNLESHKDLRLTLDTPADFEVQQLIFNEVTKQNPTFTTADIITYLDTQNPDIYKIMAQTIKENSK